MEIIYENEMEYDVDYSLIEKTAGAALKYEHFTDNTEISVTVVSLDDIRKINLEHRGIDRPTDVLSFPLIDFTRDKLKDGEKVYLGDIVLCYDKVLSQAKEYGHSVERELAFLTAHSMLHLMGYDHMEDSERLQMEEKQEAILASLNITR